MLPSDSLDHERLAVKQLQFSCILRTYLTVLKISPRHSRLLSIGMSIIIKIIIKMRQYYDRAYSARNFASSFSLKCKNTKSKGSYLPTSKKKLALGETTYTKLWNDNVTSLKNSKANVHKHGTKCFEAVYALFYIANVHLQSIFLNN